jgi:hypothetical protein
MSTRCDLATPPDVAERLSSFRKMSRVDRSPRGVEERQKAERHFLSGYAMDFRLQCSRETRH